jgi:CheY-like chemotaxis protein
MAGSAEEALQYLSNTRPNVIFMDHNMPGMDGFQAVKEIKKDPSTAMIPILMYTAKEGEVYVGQARALGAIGILNKQVRPGELFKVLKSLGLVSERRAPATAAAAVGNDVKLFSDEELPTDEFVDRVARRTARLVDTHSMQAQLASLMDDYLTRFRQEATALRETVEQGLVSVASNTANEIYDRREAEERRAEELQAAVAETDRGAGSYVKISLIAVLLLLPALWFLIMYTEARNDLSRQMQRSDAMMESVQWAINEGAQYAYGVAPFDDAWTGRLKGLISRLSWFDFRGTVQLAGHVGRFCLSGSNETGYQVADPTLPLTLCDRIGQPAELALALGEAQSDGFADYLGELQSNPDSIRVEVISYGDEQPMVPYPDPTDVATAGAWNAVAAANNRVQVNLLPNDG